MAVLAPVAITLLCLLFGVVVPVSPVAMTVGRGLPILLGRETERCALG